QARSAIEQNTGIAGERVMISATHAHTGPELTRQGVRSGTMGGDRPVAVEYTVGLPGRIAETVKQANIALAPAELLRANGSCEGLTFNRRFFMRDGTVGWNPGKRNPNIALVAGPTDPEVALLYAQRPGARSPREAVATYVNFAMHPDTTGGSKYSADWPGALSRVLAAYLGPEHVTLLGNGTCGNLNHIDVSWSGPQSGPFEQERIATILGATVFQALKDLEPVSPGTIRARAERVSLPARQVSREEIAEARATVASATDDRGGNFMKLVRGYRTLDIVEREGRPFEVEVQAITLGPDLAWVGLPGEVFVELGLAIKRRSPFPRTFVVELANENIGYIPDRRSYAEGNYEPESARCAAGSGEQLVEAAVKLLTSLHESSTP
ncbi:MAG: hypothetical protein KDM81_13680, partial [Verrucomicrobiae bacterium]|nr:hypothetical protein [Verrucomicrobiae bacterium]